MVGIFKSLALIFFELYLKSKLVSIMGLNLFRTLSCIFLFKNWLYSIFEKSQNYKKKPIDILEVNTDNYLRDL